MQGDVTNVPQDAPIRPLDVATEADCDCCDGECDVCCPDNACNATYCFCVKNLTIYFRGVNYNKAGPYCLTVWHDGSAVATDHEYARAFVIDLGSGTTLWLVLGGNLHCTFTGASGSVLQLSTANFTVEDGSGNRGTATLATDIAFLACDDIPAPTPFDVSFVVGNPFVDLSVSGDYTVADGDCGDGSPCCEALCTTEETGAAHCSYSCCEDGASWFCSPSPITAPLTATVTPSGSCAGSPFSTSVLLGPFSGDGTCFQFKVNVPDSDSTHGYFIDCDGDVWELLDFDVYTVVGGLTTTTSCDPIDITFTISGGDCAGTTIRITE
jgi:hypothetical protein